MGQKDHATSRDTKIRQPLMNKKITQLLVEKITQPLGEKKIAQPLGKKHTQKYNLPGQKSRNKSRKKSQATSWDKKIYQSLKTKKKSRSQ